jgi:hypothetical protein
MEWLVLKLKMSQVTYLAEKANQERITCHIVMVESGLSLCRFFRVFSFNIYLEILASLVICIHEIVGLWRMDFEHSLL